MPALAALAFLCASPVAVDGDTLRYRDEGLIPPSCDRCAGLPLATVDAGASARWGILREQG